jgi:murein DD-endopeptidase MepM/ murein hydrolase activator NlpD
MELLNLSSLRTSVYPFAARLRRALALVVASASSLSAQVSFPPFLELRVPKPPTVATAEHGSFLAYELYVTNFAAQPMTLRRIEVATASGERRLLLAISDSMLLRAITRPGTTLPPAERAKLAGGSRAVVFLWVPVDPASPPGSLGHRLIIERGSADSLRTEELESETAVPAVREASTIGPPLRGGPWLTANGPAAESGHRRGLIVIRGTAAIAQRFAIDYVKVGDDHLTFSGDRLKNASYHAYGTDALAVADGIVVALKDGIPENIPGPSSRAVPITLETVGGNHVIVDIGGGRYAFYAHLQPGSLRVRLGERVQRGQVVGLAGNSGNSTEPHLHFHISDGASPLGSEGLPNGFESFEIVGRCRTFNTGCERVTPVVRRGEVPLANVLIRFPR